MNTKLATGIIVLLLALILVLLFQPSGSQDTIIIEPTTFSYEQPDSLERKPTFYALFDAEQLIQDLENQGFTTDYLRDQLLQAKKHYIGLNDSMLEEDMPTHPEEGDHMMHRDYLQELQVLAAQLSAEERAVLDHEAVFRITQKIEHHQKQLYMILDTLPLVEAKEKKYRQQDIQTREAIESLGKAKEALYAERYDEAERELIAADAALDKAYAEAQQANAIVNVGKNFFVRYWWQALLVVVLLVLFTPKITKALQKTMAERKLHELNIELETLHDLIVEAQRECFERQKISTSMYNIRVERYRRRIADINSHIPVLEALVGKKEKTVRSVSPKKGVKVEVPAVIPEKTNKKNQKIKKNSKSKKSKAKSK